MANGWGSCNQWNMGCIINIYAPCQADAKRELWDIIKMVVSQNADTCTCTIGDFNAISGEGERIGNAATSSSLEIRAFNDFIRDSGLTDMDIQGRKFTWYRANGTCKSRIDRAMINDRWQEKWPCSFLRGLPRIVSDHCAIILDTKAVDWGPRPFRFINAWTNHPSFLDVVEESWKETGIDGWSCFIFKEKLKRLKEKLKKWNKEVFVQMDRNIEVAKEEIHKLDILDDTFGLTETEALKRQETTTNLFLQLKNRNSLRSQKARTKWLKEGDLNLKLFHKIVNGRRKLIEILGMEINGVWNDESTAVKIYIMEHFRR